MKKPSSTREATALTYDYTCALIEGPWQHEFISSGGSRFHIALTGPEHRSAPLVLLLHSYPQFWWAWRAQMTALASAGYRVAAMDMRGVGASDKPPSGYAVPTQAADAAGIVRSLGRERAVVVGHGTGGTIAWAMAALHPGTTQGVATLACPHPVRMRQNPLTAYTSAAWREFAFLQLPILPERALTQRDLVERTLGLGSASPLPPDVIERYTTVMRIPFAAHSAAEALHWTMRSALWMNGRRSRTALRHPLTIPTLHIQGDQDGIVRPERAELNARSIAPDLHYALIPGAGHFLPEEAPTQVNEILLDWLPHVTQTISAP